MTINLLTTFADFFVSSLSTSILKRARANNLVTINTIDLRQFAIDQHRTTDDRPFGGGPGMVMKIEPIAAALTSLGQDWDRQQSPVDQTANNHLVILTSAKGRLFTQQTAQRFSQMTSLTIICGHYEGVDERVAEHLVDEEIRIGDFVLTGGEPAALVIIDAVIRLLPGVLGNQASTADESHHQPGVLGFPQYTRPETFRSWTIPQVLISGNHHQIQSWRQNQKKKQGSTS